MHLKIKWKPFSFSLTETLRTSQGLLQSKQGWLLHLETPSGNCGWGEVSPLNANELTLCKKVFKGLSNSTTRQNLEQNINTWPGALGFGFGAALAEIDGLIGSKSDENWLNAPKSALLIPMGQSTLQTVDSLVETHKKPHNPTDYQVKSRDQTTRN